MVNIDKIVAETICRLDNKKQDDKKGLLVKLVNTEMVILLDLVTQFAEQKHEEDMLLTVKNVSFSINLSSPCISIALE